MKSTLEIINDSKLKHHTRSKQVERLQGIMEMIVSMETRIEIKNDWLKFSYKFLSYSYPEFQKRTEEELEIKRLSLSRLKQAYNNQLDKMKKF